TRDPARGMLPVRPTHLRPGQARAPVGQSRFPWKAGARLPLVPGDTRGLVGRAGSLRAVWRHAAVGDARGDRLPGVWPRAVVRRGWARRPLGLVLGLRI